MILESSLNFLRRLSTDDQESSGKTTLPLGTIDYPIHNESSAGKPAEATQIVPSCSYSRPRRNPGFLNFTVKEELWKKLLNWKKYIWWRIRT